MFAIEDLAHVSAPEESLDAAYMTGDHIPFEGRVRRVPRSPEEELTARMEKAAKGGPSPVEPIPQALVALIMAGKKIVKVTRNGLRLTVRNEEYLFWHENSLTCHPSNMGKKFTVTYDRDDLRAVHVLDEKMRYLESIPQKKLVAMFSPEALADRRRHDAVIDQVHRRVAGLHRSDTGKEHARARRNAEALQAVNTFPLSTPPCAGHRRAASFSAAEDLAEIMRTVPTDIDREEDARRAHASRAGGDLDLAEIVPTPRFEDETPAPRNRADSPPYETARDALGDLL